MFIFSIFEVHQRGSTMKVITKVANEQEAYMLKNELESKGIKVFLQNEGTGDIFNGMPFADIPVAVRDEDVEKALHIFKEWDANYGDD